MKKHIKFLITPLLVLLLSSCNITDFFNGNPNKQQQDDSTAVTGISLNCKSITIDADETYNLTAYISPRKATNQNVVWTSSNEDVATVDSEGVVTAVSVGSATITAYSEEKQTIKASCKFKITAAQEGINKTYSQYTYEDYTKNNIYNLSCAPSQGEARLLVIPVWFTDSGNYITEKETVRNDINKAYFGSSEQTGWESVKSYYEKDSFGHVRVNGFVSKWYECGRSSTEFYSEDGGSRATSNLVKNAIEWYKKEYHTSKLTYYDQNQDGYLDGVMLIYGAPDYSALRNYSARNLWAYCYWIQSTSANPEDPNPNVFFWASYDFMYSPSSATADRVGTWYGSGDQTHCIIDAHTYIHEMGHVFGLADYYDYTGGNSPAAGFSMQDYNVGAHDPFSRFALGWSKAYIPTTTSTFTVDNMEASGKCVLLSPSFSGSAFDEYILLELFTKTGINESDSTHRYDGRSTVDGYGVRAWHVDARLVSMNEYGNIVGLTTNPEDYYVTSATSNSTYTGPDSQGRALNYAGQYEYNQLQLIRNNTSANYDNPRSNPLNSSMMFHTGDTFSLEKYASQFFEENTLNNGKALGWEVYFNSVTESSMTITCTKL